MTRLLAVRPSLLSLIASRIYKIIRSFIYIQIVYDAVPIQAFIRVLVYSMKVIPLVPSDIISKIQKQIFDLQAA